PAEMRFYDSMARALLKNNARDRVAELFSLMAATLTAKGRAAEAVELVRIAWRYAPDLGELSESAVEALRALHGNRPNFKLFVSASDLDQRADLFRALERFETFIYCDTGEVFEHQTLGIGVVEAIEPERRRVAIRFSSKAVKEFTFEGVRDFLKKHERGGFRAERVRDPDGLKRRFLDEPVEFLHFVLKDYPLGLSQADLKNLLLDGFVSRDEWERWWSANRRAFRRDPWVDWGGGTHDAIRLRSEPKTYYEEVAAEFCESESASARMSLIAEIAKHIAEEPPSAGFARQLFGALQTEFGNCAPGDQVGRLERIFLGRQLAKAFINLELPREFDETAILRQADDPAQMILALSSHEFQCQAIQTLDMIDRTKTTKVCARIFPDAPARLAQWLVERLIAQGEVGAVSAAFETALRSPARNPDAFLWAARQFFADRYAALSVEIAPHEIVGEMADYIRELQNQVDSGSPNASTLRGVVARFKNLLADDQFEILRRAIIPLALPEAQAVCRLFESHAAFPDTYLSSLRHAVQQARPDLEEATAAAARDELDGTTLFVTAESLQRRQAELHHLRTVEIPKNSREIGEAASHGDLSENAEYEAARHRQRMIFKRAEELQHDVERARLIVPSWIRADCVWVGTRFQARNLDTGEVETYTILGAWDSKPDENILSYLTPAAAQFLRRRVGDKVAFQRSGAEPIRYEILQIEKALK
ncbi:GreA/GreB family elongation factor, partial [Candidatus Sumerlaeota bacterium]|nr:GreA/GreB family elongation factor [Candidatus Sumerlaeota bacterium]